MPDKRIWLSSYREKAIQEKEVRYKIYTEPLLLIVKNKINIQGLLAGRFSPGMMLTDFITKTPDGEQSEIIADEKFRKIFNILADKPDTIAKFSY